MFNPKNHITLDTKPLEESWIFQGPINTGMVLPLIKKNSNLNGDLKVVGWKNHPKCFYYKVIGSGVIKVGIMDNSPESLTDLDVDKASIFKVEAYPGWGYKFLGMIK